MARKKLRQSLKNPDVFLGQKLPKNGAMINF